MLNTGDQAPDFELKDQSGALVRLSDLLARGPVLVYFYPRDFSMVCTAQACALRDEVDLDTEGATQVVGISTQGARSHQQFAERHKLPFTLLSDPDKRVIKAWGVDGPFGIAVRRASFLVGTDGVIARRVVSDLLVGTASGTAARLLSLLTNPAARARTRACRHETDRPAPGHCRCAHRAGHSPP